MYLSHIRFVATDLIINEGITDVFSNLGRSLNIVLAFLVALGVYAVVQHVSGVPDES